MFLCVDISTWAFSGLFAVSITFHCVSLLWDAAAIPNAGIYLKFKIISIKRNTQKSVPQNINIFYQ